MYSPQEGEGNNLSWSTENWYFGVLSEKTGENQPQSAYAVLRSRLKRPNTSNFVLVRSLCVYQFLYHYNLYSLPSIIRMIKSRKARWTGHVARIEKGGRGGERTQDFGGKARRKWTTRET
jgi:hypothetical protein